MRRPSVGELEVDTGMNIVPSRVVLANRMSPKLPGGPGRGAKSGDKPTRPRVVLRSGTVFW